jgi:N6-L-threonylcarbamoyladenine synthase
LLDDPQRLDFSFSGLKTAVRYLVAGPGKVTGDHPSDGTRFPVSGVADIAASFQEAVIDCLVGKAQFALEKTGYETLCVGGGVAANSRFRERLAGSSQERGYTVHVPPLALCTDNAVMGAIAIERYRAGLIEDLSLDIGPGPERAASR